MLLCLICILAFFCFLNVKSEIFGCVLRGPGRRETLPRRNVKNPGAVIQDPKSQEPRIDEILGSALRYSIP